MDRSRWTERRRKQPSLYDEYLNEERAASHQSSSRQRSISSDQDDTSTIRAITPDSQSDEPLVQAQTTKNFERDFLSLSSSPSSPPRSLRKEKGSPRIGSSGHKTLTRSESATVASRDHGAIGAGESQRRPRTRTLQDSSQPTKPLSIPRTTRPRPGSVHYGRGSSSSIAEGVVSTRDRSLPSSFSQPAMSAIPSGSSQDGFSVPSRTKSNSSVSTSSLTSGQLPSPNQQRIVHLMKTVCGRMSGKVSFRRGPTSPWSSAHCYIKEEEGSLMSESDIDASHNRQLIPDLRGCHLDCVRDEDTRIPHVEITTPSSLTIHLRATNLRELRLWFAALLCWQSLRPKGIANRMIKPQATLLSRPFGSQARHNSEPNLLKEAPVIKVGRMILWETNFSVPPTASIAKQTIGRPTVARMTSFGYRNYGSQWWKRVSCTLRENGELKLFTEADNTLVSVVQLSQLSRCAIQRLDPSVLDNDYCIAVYPQYNNNTVVTSTNKPVFLSLETRLQFEVWFVLLRAFTAPQLYGPKLPNLDEDGNFDSSNNLEKLLAQSRGDMFRMERSLSIRIIEGKVNPDAAKASPDPSGFRAGHSPKMDSVGGLYAEVHLDGETRGKTQVRNDGLSPFWREDFEYQDLPAVLSSAHVFLKHRPPDTTSARGQYEARLIHEAYGLIQTPQSSGASSGYTGISHDQTLGKVEIVLEELGSREEIEKWWPVVNTQRNEKIGEVLIRARADEDIILMRQEYEPISQLLHSFENGVTIAIALAIPLDIKRLSDLFLNIFQVSGRVTDWLMALVEEEIDGLGKETPLSRSRYSQKPGNGEVEAGYGNRLTDRELVVRDMNKNAALEANLLFRGNTLLTKALDAHMRRVGKDYLFKAIGPVINSICERNPDCEVDPNKVSSQHEMNRNWSRLLATTSEMWESINASAQNCPVELRFIFRHIKACAEDRYGDFLRTVSYSSVSGFLFLRFFCPAILNPKLFDLIQDDPKPKARRTFTLLAKSLQTLANMATFGSKEHWMEPMNAFLTSHRDAFKKFIEEVCFVSHPPSALIENNPSYQTPATIKNRLPITSREGFPSLPYLLDEARDYASLVNMWLHASSSQGRGGASSEIDEDGPLHKFHNLCSLLHARTQECLSRAERAERPTSEHSFSWEEALRGLGGSSLLDTIDPLSDDDPTPYAEGSSSLDDTIASVAETLRSQPAPSTSDNEASDYVPTSPHRRGHHDWEHPPPDSNSPPSAAATAAATLLAQDRNPRAGFVLPQTSTSVTSALGTRASASTNAPGVAPPNTAAAREAADQIIRLDTSVRPSSSNRHDPISAPPISNGNNSSSSSPYNHHHALPSLSDFRGGVTTTIIGGPSAGVHSGHNSSTSSPRPTSALSGRYSASARSVNSLVSEGDADTALPEIKGSRTQRDRASVWGDQGRKSGRSTGIGSEGGGKRESGSKDRERERARQRQRLKGFVGDLGLRGKRRDRD